MILGEDYGQGLHELLRQVFGYNARHLKFHRMNVIRYRQFGSGFIPGLSIIDALMFNSIPSVTSLLSSYTLEEPGACPIPYARCFVKSGSASA
jgi:hypothetical protein